MDRVWDGLDLSMSALFQVFFGAHASAAAASYDLVEENCEGVGTPSGWTNSGSPNWDYTATVLQGSESCLQTAGSSSYDTFTAVGTAYGYALIRVGTLPGSTITICGFRATDDSARALVRMNTSGQISIFANGSDSSFTVDSMSTGVTYHLWWNFIASGACDVGFSTDGTKPTSGNKFVTKTGGSGTVGRYSIYGTTNVIFDRMLASTTAIGNSP